ncbi:MAG: DMT family transporter [Thermoanaerobaculia bacterium]
MNNRTWLYLWIALALFLVWSNSFVAASYLLGGEHVPAQLDWASLSTARFTLLAPICLIYSFFFRRRQSLDLLRRFPLRTPISALLAVPAYNLALYYGQQHGIPPPVAALASALTPLFLLLFSAVALGEPFTARKGAAFAVAISGLFIIALSRGGFAGLPTFGLMLAITAIAPISWSAHTVLSKSVVDGSKPARGAGEASATMSGARGPRGSALDWTYLTMGLGSLPLVALFPWHGAPELAHLHAGGWVALLHLSVLSALIGYAVWSWLLERLPASTVAFFVFLNPPLTLISKFLLAAALPAIFVFHLNGQELAGSALALAGLAIAIWPQSARRSQPATR